MSAGALDSAAVSTSVGDEANLQDATPAPEGREGSGVSNKVHRRVSSLIEQIESCDDSARRIELLHKVARLYEDKLDEPQDAFDALLLAWAEDYAHQPTADALARMAAQSKRWQALIGVANEALTHDLPTDQRVAVCLHCAGWYRDQLEQPDNAALCYQQVLTFDPGHVEATLALARLYEKAQRWDVLLQLLQRAAQLSGDANDRLDIFLRLGELCEQRLGRPERAIEYYAQALEIDDCTQSAIEALERLYAQGQHHEELVALLQRRVEHTRDRQQVSALWLRIARTLQDGLGDTDQAIEAYEKAVAFKDVGLDALRALESLYRRTERWQPLSSLLERQVDVVSTRGERIEVLLELAQLWERQFVKPDRAIDCLRRARDLDRNNVAVLDGLVRLNRLAQRWPQVVDALQDRLAATAERSEKVELHRSIAELCAGEVADLPRAAVAFEAAHELDPGDVEVLRGLVAVHERTGDARAAVQGMDRLLQLEREDAAQADLLYRMGQLYQHQLGDAEAALVHYERALELNGDHFELLKVVREAYTERADWHAACRVLRLEIAARNSPRILADLHLRLARIQGDELGQAGQALENLERACKHDPANPAATLALAQAHVHERRWERALPLLKRVVKHSRATESAAEETSPGRGRPRFAAKDRHRAAYLLGEVATRSGDYKLAAEGYTQALELDPRDMRSALGAATAYFRLEDWPNVHRAYEQLLSDWRSELGAKEQAFAYRRIGLALLAQDKHRKAIRMLESAQRALPDDSQTLRALGAVHEERGQWKKVIRYKTLLAEQADGDERIRLQCEIAALWRDEVGKPERAIKSLRAALEQSRGSHVLLHELLSMYQGLERWLDAIEVIQTIAEGEERPEVAAKYLYTAGVIARDEVRDPRRAVEHFEGALDTDPAHLKSFEAINRLLTDRKDFKRLERSFRKMIHRLGASPGSNPELLHHLWHNLGVIHRDRLGDLKSAAQAFEQARRLKPDSDTAHCILAELYARIPGAVRRAAAEHYARVERNPSSASAYRSLYQLYRQHRANDRAWCAARVLVHLGKANREEAAFHDRFEGVPRFNGRRLTSEDWLQHLYHPDHDRALATIFRLLAGPLHERRHGGAVAALRPDVHTRVDHDSPLSEVVRHASQVLAPDVLPRLGVARTGFYGLRSVAGPRPTSLAGKLAMESKDLTELNFIAGHHLSYHRSEHYIRTLLPARKELGTALLVAMRSIGDEDGGRETAKGWKTLSAGLTADKRERIQKACAIFARRGEPADLKRYVQTTELTACRAGLLLADDLGTALRTVRHLESAGPDDASPSEKANAMLSFSVSEDYFELRDRLGLSVGAPPGSRSKRP